MKTLKTTFLLTALTLLLLFVGQMLGGSRGLTMALVFAIIMNGGAYFFSDKIALASSGAVPISREQAPRLYAVMERLAAKANLPMPKLYLIPQPAPNAFATGRNPSHAAVCASTGPPRSAPPSSGAARRSGSCSRMSPPRTGTWAARRSASSRKAASCEGEGPLPSANEPRSAWRGE